MNKEEEFHSDLRGRERSAAKISRKSIFLEKAPLCFPTTVVKESSSLVLWRRLWHCVSKKRLISLKTALLLFLGTKGRRGFFLGV